MSLSDSQVSDLLREIPITPEWPWSTRNEKTIDKHIKKIIADLCRTLHLLDKTEYGHYGSGYASYVDCWLYRDDANFREGDGNSFWGLVVLFSRLSKYFVIGEGHKSWTNNSASGYLPCFEFVDQIKQSCVLSLVDVVTNLLAAHNFERLFSKDLSELLPSIIQVPTILSDPPYHQFDALYYWED